MEKRRPRVRDVVIFHDSKGKGHSALLKAVWDGPREPDDLTEFPCVNLVYVSDDTDRQDGAGRQTIVESSVVHKNWGNAVHGNYWRFDWEDPIPYREPSDV